jgi:PAS domain S-box-containing protein
MEDSEWKVLEKEGLYHNLMKNASHAIFIVNDEGVIIEVNKAAEKLTGYSESELEGRSFLELHPGKEHLKIMEQFSKASETRKGLMKEIELIRKDHKKRCVNITARMVGYGNKDLGIAILTDVTQEKAMRKKLQENEKNYKEALDAINTPIHVVDKDLRIVFANKEFIKWCNQLKLTSRIVGKRISEAFPFLNKNVEQEYQKVFKGKGVTTEEDSEVNGKEVHTQTRKIPIFSEGKVERVVTVVIN